MKNGNYCRALVMSLAVICCGQNYKGKTGKRSVEQGGFNILALPSSELRKDAARLFSWANKWASNKIQNRGVLQVEEFKREIAHLTTITLAQFLENNSINVYDLVIEADINLFEVLFMAIERRKIPQIAELSDYFGFEEEDEIKNNDPRFLR